jgi:hypothetical protein
VPERRLAITIKGAISLGAYEAGAIAETLRLIAYNNRRPGPTTWYVDAVCGASAGSITAAMVAAALVRGDTDLFYETWVTGVSLATLAADDDEMSDNTILDALALDALARQYLTCPASATPHPALRPAPSSLELRFTLSRFSPTTISGHTLNQTKLQFHEYQDSADFTVATIAPVPPSSTIEVSFQTTCVASAGYHNSNPVLNGADAWSALTQTAIASGSFPFAFAPRDLRRWNNAWIDRYFQDGGTNDNDPIGQTINIAHAIDWSSSPAAKFYADADRRFLMIHVEPFQDDPFEIVPNAPITLDVNPLDLAERFFPAILDETENSGLRGISTVNAQIVERNRFLNELADLIVSGTAPALPVQIITALAKFRDLDADKVRSLRGYLLSDLQESKDAVQNAVFAKLAPLSDALKSSFLDLALAYDLATNLTDKTTLTPILISPAESLSGSGLYAFGGFLVQRLRERDYAQGVYDAYQSWKAVAETQQDFLIDPNSPPDPPASATELFPQCKDEYQKGIERLVQRVDRVIGALSSGATGGGIFGGAVRIALDAVANHYLRKAGSDQEIS